MRSGAFVPVNNSLNYFLLGIILRFDLLDMAPPLINISAVWLGRCSSFSPKV
jgi:hypothetical protein